MNEENRFRKTQLSEEEAFWVMFYFLKEHYVVSGGHFDVSDILSASEPMAKIEDSLMPADSSMIDYWQEAVDKLRKDGPPEFKQFKK